MKTLAISDESYSTLVHLVSVGVRATEARIEELDGEKKQIEQRIKMLDPQDPMTQFYKIEMQCFLKVVYPKEIKKFTDSLARCITLREELEQ